MYTRLVLIIGIVVAGRILLSFNERLGRYDDLEPNLNADPNRDPSDRMPPGRPPDWGDPPWDPPPWEPPEYPWEPPEDGWVPDFPENPGDPPIDP